LVFNFIFQLKFMLFYFFQFIPLSFDLFLLLLKILFFNLTLKFNFFMPPNLYLYLYFHPHSFNYNFLCDWFFFLISSFGVWFVQDWASQFFHLSIYHFFMVKENWFCGYFNFFIGLSWFHDLGQRFFKPFLDMFFFFKLFCLYLIFDELFYFILHK